NHNFKSYIITPTEIAYYKAEAILRFGVSGDAKAEFARGFVASVKMFADINEQSDCSTLSYLTRSPLVVDAAWKAQWADYGKSFAEGLWDAASDKLALVYEQFWVHNWLFGTLESWNSVRRTGVPDLIYPYFADGNPIQVVPAREIIPADEHSKNPNIPDETVTSYTPDKAYWETLFWAKDLTKSPNCKKP
ncbi:MAG: SusD/RagB family nutrient-binding outer membrane lipoprotein, partial [Tannerella sp.]|nr:SusD/RagB family nutrient-binding outer membrane lipoprotein [Tannerella sp.]